MSLCLLQRVLVSLDRKEDALVVAERGRTRAFVDLLLERQNVGDDIWMEDPGPITMEMMVDTVTRQRSAVLYYSLAAGWLYCWLLLPGKGGYGGLTLIVYDLVRVDRATDKAWKAMKPHFAHAYICSIYM